MSSTVPAVKYRAATLEDVHYVAVHIRKADFDEVHASTGTPPKDALEESFFKSKRTWVATVKGRPVCLFGIGEADKQTGIPWMVATDMVTAHRSRLLIDARSIVEDMQAAYPVLANFVHERNTLSRRWLQWLGFRFLPATPLGPRHEPFIPFYRLRECVNQ